MNANTGVYQGQKRFDVRYTIQEDLKKAGLYVDKKDNPMKVPLCEKSKDVIEPLMKPQWWMKMRDLADEAIKVVKNGEIKSGPNQLRRATTNGWRTSTIGVYLDNCGGDIKSPSILLRYTAKRATKAMTSYGLLGAHKKRQS
jgi:hypothetical protein